MEYENQLRSAILGYLSVLDVDECNNQLSIKEREEGRKSIMGCLHTLTNLLDEIGDSESLCLRRTINVRERLNGQIANPDAETLVKSTEYCAKEALDYFVQRCKST